MTMVSMEATVPKNLPRTETKTRSDLVKKKNVKQNVIRLFSLIWFLFVIALTMTIIILNHMLIFP